ncbi:unnamed protein product, partial [Cylindrotheca closterium]
MGSNDEKSQEMALKSTRTAPEHAQDGLEATTRSNSTTLLTVDLVKDNPNEHKFSMLYSIFVLFLSLEKIQQTDFLGLPFQIPTNRVGAPICPLTDDLRELHSILSLEKISFYKRLSTFLYFYHPPSKMAAAIPVFTIYDAMILCQIPDTGNFQGQTDAQRMAEELFDNNFGTAMTKSIKQVNMDLATLASLTAVQGRIVSRPRAQDRIRAFVQWVRDEIRMGRNPAQHPFPAGDTSTLLQRLNFHQKYVKDSKTLIDNTVPPKWSKEQQWKQWVKLLRDHLRAYI